MYVRTYVSTCPRRHLSSGPHLHADSSAPSARARTARTARARSLTAHCRAISTRVAGKAAVVGVVGNHCKFRRRALVTEHAKGRRALVSVEIEELQTYVRTYFPLSLYRFAPRGHVLKRVLLWLPFPKFRWHKIRMVRVAVTRLFI